MQPEDGGVRAVAVRVRGPDPVPYAQRGPEPGGEADRRLELLGRVSAYGDLIEWLHDTAPSREELQRMLHRLPADAWVVLMAQYPEESLLTDPQDRRLCAALRQLCDGLPRAEAEVLRRAAAHVHWE